jgi:hypothetical protein
MTFSTRKLKLSLILLLNVLAILFIFPASAAGAPIVVAQVVWVKGAMSAAAPGQSPRALQRRSPIYNLDTLTTNTDSSGEIVFSDNTIMSIRADSIIRIDEYKFNRNGSAASNAAITTIIKGGFRTITGIISKGHPENYQVKTPVATIGVRGTEYDAILKDGKFYIEFHKGTPFVKNNAGTTYLSAEHPYARVVSADQAPELLAEKPDVFEDEQPLTAAAFSPLSGIVGPNNVADGFCIN